MATFAGHPQSALSSLQETTVVSIHLDAMDEGKRVKLLANTLKVCGLLYFGGPRDVGGNGSGA